MDLLQKQQKIKHIPPSVPSGSQDLDELTWSNFPEPQPPFWLLPLSTSHFPPKRIHMPADALGPLRSSYLGSPGLLPEFSSGPAWDWGPPFCCCLTLPPCPSGLGSSAQILFPFQRLPQPPVWPSLPKSHCLSSILPWYFSFALPVACITLYLLLGGISI